eukprot:SAG11_NODE_8826_length_972_cov_2.085911_1_plen_100_part_10
MHSPAHTLCSDSVGLLSCFYAQDAVPELSFVAGERLTVKAWPVSKGLEGEWWYGTLAIADPPNPQVRAAIARPPARPPTRPSPVLALVLPQRPCQTGIFP